MIIEMRIPGQKNPSTTTVLLIDSDDVKNTTERLAECLNQLSPDKQTLKNVSITFREEDDDVDDFEYII